jgi:hypothetical protein
MAEGMKGLLATALPVLLLGGCSAPTAPPTPAEGYWCWMPFALPGPHRITDRSPGPREEPCNREVVDFYLHGKPWPTYQAR